jgi:hypothetical protein
MDKYQKKQIKVGLVYLLIIAIIIGGIYLIIKPGLPSCSDGIQNQGEAGVDCGGPCPPCPWQLQEDLEIISSQAIPTQKNHVDLLAVVKNPNSDFGAKSFSYIFNLYDFQNNLIISREGNSYILPQETRYIIEQRVETDVNISKVEFKINNVEWQELVDYQEPELLIRNPNFSQSEELSQLSATLENRSNYDFDKIDVWAVLFDKESNILGANKIELRTVLSEEKRYFEMKWFFPILGQVERSDVVAKTNVFLDENFMKRYGGEQEKFQEY